MDTINAASILCSLSGTLPNMCGIPVYVRGSNEKNTCAHCYVDTSPMWRRGFPLSKAASGEQLYSNLCNACGIKARKVPASCYNK